MKTLALKFIIIIAVKDHGANSFESRGHLGLHCQTKKKIGRCILHQNFIPENYEQYYV